VNKAASNPSRLLGGGLGVPGGARTALRDFALKDHSGPVEDDMDENARIAELEQAGAVTDKPNSRWRARACGSG